MARFLFLHVALTLILFSDLAWSTAHEPFVSTSCDIAEEAARDIRKSTRIYGLMDLQTKDLKGRAFLHQVLIKHMKLQNIESEDLINSIYGLVVHLRKNGASIDERDKEGRTMLLDAVSRGGVAVAKALILAGANIEIKDDMGRTPLHWAIVRGIPSLIAFLLAHNASMFAEDFEEFTPIQLAAKQGNPVSIRLLLDAGSPVVFDNISSSDEQPIYLAAANGRDDCVRMMVMHHVRQFMAAGGDINKPGVMGLTPLHFAAIDGDAVLVEELLNRNAEVNVVDVMGRTPLDLAYKQNNNPMVWRQLRNAGAKRGEAVPAEYDCWPENVPGFENTELSLGDIF